MLKRIKNPVPMYAKRIETTLPAFGEEVGYDLQAGDWVAPHGKGKVADLVCFGTLVERSRYDADYELKVNFSNPGDGLQRFQPEPDSAIFRSSYEAPVNGYVPEWILKRKRRPDVKDETNFNDKAGYFFRVRTVLDENGKVVKALYGKIYGDFFNMTYYLNPDGTRNMECDPKRNLLKWSKARDRSHYEVGP